MEGDLEAQQPIPGRKRGWLPRQTHGTHHAAIGQAAGHAKHTVAEGRRDGAQGCRIPGGRLGRRSHADARGQQGERHRSA